MWVSNAFFEWTHVKSSTSEGRRQCCQFYMAISPLCKSVTEVMFWFIMYVNESIESTHHELVCFQGSNFVALFTLIFLYFSSCSRFVSTVILTNYKRTHKAATRQSVWNRFYWQSKTQPPICAPFGTKSYILLCIWTKLCTNCTLDLVTICVRISSRSLMFMFSFSLLKWGFWNSACWCLPWVLLGHTYFTSSDSLCSCFKSHRRVENCGRTNFLKFDMTNTWNAE